MRVLVCGGREYDDEGRIERVLDTIQEQHGPFTLVITGGCRGADAMAERWARLRGVPVKTFMALWNLYGRQAGPMRNREMLTLGKPDIVVAFPGGRGTANLVGGARQRGLPIIEVS